jgi:hypothetical protein
VAALHEPAAEGEDREGVTRVAEGAEKDAEWATVRASDPITELRRAIDCLPVTTREAMLEGIGSNPIVVGAYTDDHGGICPMLAAHRNGGRTTFLSFARAWDAFSRTKKVRRATRHEMATLEGQLVASLMAGDDVDLRAAIADHEALRRRTEAEAGGAAFEITAERLNPRSRIRALRPSREDRAAAIGTASKLATLERVERELARTS